MRLFIPLALYGALAACTGQYDPDICAAGGPKAPRLTREAKACVQKRASALATSIGDARDVADAVLAECSGILLGDDATTKGLEAEPTTDEGSNARWAEARELAVFQVVEERAGRCSLKK
jgi:hypothetical protein